MTRRETKQQLVMVAIVLVATLFGPGKSTGDGGVTYGKLAIESQAKPPTSGLPTLSSNIRGDFLSSRGEDCYARVTLASWVDKTGDTIQYSYEFTNNWMRDVKMLITLPVRDKTVFVGEFVTQDAQKSIFITIPAKQTHHFRVRDKLTKVIPVYPQVFFIDKYDSVCGSSGTSLYLPGWEHLFGK